MGHLDPYNKNQIRDKLFLVLILLRACKDRKQCRTRAERMGEKDGRNVFHNNRMQPLSGEQLYGKGNENKAGKRAG